MQQIMPEEITNQEEMINSILEAGIEEDFKVSAERVQAAITERTKAVIFSVGDTKFYREMYYLSRSTYDHHHLSDLFIMCWKRSSCYHPPMYTMW